MSIQETFSEIRKRGWTFDTAWIAIALIFTALAVLASHQVPATASFVVKAVVGVLPFFLVSILLTAYAKATGAESLIAGAFTGRRSTMVVFASLIGALSPFCSCGVIPVIAALLATGVPLAPVMAFWLASPLMDPSMFVLTAGLLGTQFALAKTLAAISVGLLGGFAVLALERQGILSGNPLREGVGNGGCSASRIRNPKAVVWRFWEERERGEAFRANVLQNSLFLGKWLLLAFVLESLMVAYVPGQLIASIVGDGGLLSILVAALVGIPSYLNGNAALPLVSGLMDKGMAPGAAMAFLMGGGVTSVPAMLAVWAIATRRVFAVYLAVAITGAVLSGLLYQMYSA